MAKWGLNQASSFQMRIFFFQIIYATLGFYETKKVGTDELMLGLYD